MRLSRLIKLAAYPEEITPEAAKPNQLGKPLSMIDGALGAQIKGMMGKGTPTFNDKPFDFAGMSKIFNNVTSRSTSPQTAQPAGRWQGMAPFEPFKPTTAGMRTLPGKPEDFMPGTGNGMRTLPGKFMPGTGLGSLLGAGLPATK